VRYSLPDFLLRASNIFEDDVRRFIITRSVLVYYYYSTLILRMYV